MNRTQAACYSLIASLFVLASLLIVSVSGRLTPLAHAEMVVNKEGLTLLTASTRSGEESLFVLDAINEKLLIYRLDLGKKQLELAGAADLRHLFQGGDEGRGRQAR
jgi:hypothetical protein